MRYAIICIVLLLPLLACEEATRPEEPTAGYFRVDSLYASFFVDRDFVGRIRSNLDVGYDCHFEGSAGYVKCNGLRSIILDYDARLCTLDPELYIPDSVYHYTFGVWGYHDYSYLTETEIQVTIEGWFDDCPYCDDGCERCSFVWTGKLIVEVENRLED